MLPRVPTPTPAPKTVPGGDATAGKAAIQKYACGSCHLIPGIPNATGNAAPPLAGFADKQYIIADILNTPENLISWLSNPMYTYPSATMPNLGLSDADARDIAAYLYTLTAGAPTGGSPSPPPSPSGTGAATGTPTATPSPGGSPGPTGVPTVPGGNPTAGQAAIQKYGCGSCHVIPGVAGANGSVGPSLAGFATKSTIAGTVPNTPDNLIKWIMNPQAVKPGTTMPNLGVTQTDARDIAAYLYTLTGGTPASPSTGTPAATSSPGGAPSPTGTRTVPGGNPTAGEAAIEKYGCGSCHVIPGVPGASGTVGPSLAGFADKPTIAGTVPNTPDNLIKWIMNPQAVKPGTTMPNLGVTQTDARDIAAYLYTLTAQGSPTPTPTPTLERGPTATPTSVAGTPVYPPVPGGISVMGQYAIVRYGCGNCHVVPGVLGAIGTDGPALYNWVDQMYIADEVPNTPDNLIEWIMNPKQLVPDTTMPNLGVTRQDAADIASYLYAPSSAFSYGSTSGF
ncbi:MAG: c-type cytochrome [Chloroflexota bacterium]